MVNAKVLKGLVVVVETLGRLLASLDERELRKLASKLSPEALAGYVRLVSTMTWEQVTSEEAELVTNEEAKNT